MCYRQKSTATASYLRKHGLDDSIVCKEKSIPDWHLNLSGLVIPDALIEQFILQVVVEDSNTFNRKLNLDKDPTGLISASEISRRKYHEKHSNGVIDAMLRHHITNPQTVLGILVTEDHAREYCKMIGKKFFAKKWTDKVLYISI